MELKSLRITGVGVSGGTLGLSLDVYNPNDFLLRAMRIESELRLEDTHFGTAVLEEEALLEPLSHTMVEVPLTFSWTGAGAGAREVLERGSASYTLDTELSIEAPMGEGSIEVRSTGLVTLQDVLP